MSWSNPGKGRGPAVQVHPVADSTPSYGRYINTTRKDGDQLHNCNHSTEYYRFKKHVIDCTDSHNSNKVDRCIHAQLDNRRESHRNNKVDEFIQEQLDQQTGQPHQY